jgi:hypothetical protein
LDRQRRLQMHCQGAFQLRVLRILSRHP